MHELSIAMSIVEIAEEEVKKANAAKVSEIELEIGKMSGVVVEALEFAMEEAVKNSVLSQAKRKIIEIEAKAQCASCKHEFTTEDHYTPCPKCMHPYSDIISGKEMKIKTLKIE